MAPGRAVAERSKMRDLDGRRLLVVEDEYLIAREVAAALRRAGAAVVGPVPTVDEAMAAVEGDAALDAALLDINLRGDLVYPVVDALAERGVPVVFATGYDAGTIPDRYAGIRRCDKPAEAATVIRALHDALGDAPGNAGAGESPAQAPDGDGQAGGLCAAPGRA